MHMTDTTWQAFFASESQLPYAKNLEQFLDQAYAEKTIYPPRQHMYAAFELCPLNQVKVVIIGQDPYHQLGQANGLAFSVNPGVLLPPSLKNIYKEIAADLNITMDVSKGDLSYLAKQGVLLLNSILTVEAHRPLSHQAIGYDQFFRHVLTLLNTIDSPMMFLLWGQSAQRYQTLIDHRLHAVLKAHHPSPLSANRGGWFGSKHFSQTNLWLMNQGLSPIHWSNNP
jgi:uracil-DNA glycosylase